MPSSHLALFVDEFSGSGPVDIDPGLVLAVLCELPDPRRKRGVRHRFAHLLVIMVCAVIAGQKTLVEIAEWAADTARDQLAALGIGAPHATTLGRVLERLDADAMDNLIGAWAQVATATTAIAMDGKEVRGAKNGGGARVHLMSAIDHNTGAVLGQVSVAEKSNEIPYFSTLLDGIKDVRGVVTTADAMHTQRGHAIYLNGRGAHYVLTVKGNQPRLHHQLESLPWKRIRAGDRTREQANGRQIERTVKCVSVAGGHQLPPRRPGRPNHPQVPARRHPEMVNGDRLRRHLAALLRGETRADRGLDPWAQHSEQLRCLSGCFQDGLVSGESALQAGVPVIGHALVVRSFDPSDDRTMEIGFVELHHVVSAAHAVPLVPRDVVSCLAA